LNLDEGFPRTADFSARVFSRNDLPRFDFLESAAPAGRSQLLAAGSSLKKSGLARATF